MSLLPFIVVLYMLSYCWKKSREHMTSTLFFCNCLYFQNTKDNPPCNTLFIGNLGENINEDELRGLFSVYVFSFVSTLRDFVINVYNLQCWKLYLERFFVINVYKLQCWRLSFSYVLCSQPGYKQMKILRQERHTVCFIEFEVSNII